MHPLGLLWRRDVLRTGVHGRLKRGTVDSEPQWVTVRKLEVPHRLVVPDVSPGLQLLVAPVPTPPPSVSRSL